MTTPDERLTRLEAERQHLATKEDITRLEGATKEDMARLEGIIRESVAQTHAAISQLEARQIRWLIGLMAGSVAAATAIAVFIQRLTGG